MNKINERIREYRKGLHLSQEYVANCLGISRAGYTMMENGKRRITVENLSALSTLFGVSADTLLHGEEMGNSAIAFAREFDKLNEQDQAEIMSLIRFKQRYQSQKNAPHT